MKPAAYVFSHYSANCHEYPTDPSRKTRSSQKEVSLFNVKSYTALSPQNVYINVLNLLALLRPLDLEVEISAHVQAGSMAPVFETNFSIFPL